jgi:hypothetical protein
VIGLRICMWFQSNPAYFKSNHSVIEHYFGGKSVHEEGGTYSLKLHRVL